MSPVRPLLLGLEEDEVEVEVDGDQHFYTPFRSGRLSTLLVMGVDRDLPASVRELGGCGSWLCYVPVHGRRLLVLSHPLTCCCCCCCPPQAILSALGPVCAQLRSVHILRDYRYGHRCFLLLTLESPEAAERLHHAYNCPPPPTATEVGDWPAGLPGRRSLFVSGVVLVEAEGAAVLSCLRSVMQAASTAAAAAADHQGLVHQGRVSGEQADTHREREGARACACGGRDDVVMPTCCLLVAVVQ